jgi:hypothetical protein
MDTAMREAWTDERLDDLNRKIDEGFARLEAESRERRREVRTELVALRGELHGVQRLVLQVGGGMLTTMLVGFASLVVTQL